MTPSIYFQCTQYIIQEKIVRLGKYKYSLNEITSQWNHMYHSYPLLYYQLQLVLTYFYITDSNKLEYLNVSGNIDLVRPSVLQTNQPLR